MEARLSPLQKHRDHKEHVRGRAWFDQFADPWANQVAEAIECIMMHIVAAGVLTPKVMALMHANLLPRPAEVVAHAGQALYRFKSFIDDATPKAGLPIGNIQEVGRHLTDVTTAAETCPALFKNIPWFHEKVKEVMAEWIELLKSTQAKLENAGQAIDE